MVDGSFLTRDGLTLSTWRIRTQAADSAPVILIHGLSDHSRSMPYLQLGRSLAEQGFEVFAFDRRGSGRSAGPANFARSFEELREDLSRFVDIVEDQCRRLPALVGLSLGGLQALDFSLARPESVPACVAMAPALDVSGTSRWVRLLLPILAAWRPTLEVDPGLDDSALVRDALVCRAYRTDPLWRARTTPALALAVMEAIASMERNAAELVTPLLVLHGTADRVVPIAGTRRIFPRFGSPDKTLKELPGAFHALPIEAEAGEVADLIAGWLKARGPKPPERPTLFPK